jgi:hypothetical protein
MFICPPRSYGSRASTGSGYRHAAAIPATSRKPATGFRFCLRCFHFECPNPGNDRDPTLGEKLLGAFREGRRSNAGEHDLNPFVPRHQRQHVEQPGRGGDVVHDREDMPDDRPCRPPLLEHEHRS